MRTLYDRAGVALTPAFVLAQRINVTPDKSKAPGSRGLQDAINGFAYYALLASIAGFLLGAACWAIGGRVGNDYTATGGKVGIAVSVGVAFLVGAAAAILNFAYNAGGN
jgi:vacuolar-type H+-ATPase subunit I/STV1